MLRNCQTNRAKRLSRGYKRGTPGGRGLSPENQRRTPTQKLARNFWANAPPNCTGRKRLVLEFYVSGFFSRIFEKPFGFFEQWHWRVADQLDNEKDDDSMEDGRA